MGLKGKSCHGLWDERGQRGVESRVENISMFHGFLCIRVEINLQNYDRIKIFSKSTGIVN